MSTTTWTKSMTPAAPRWEEVAKLDPAAPVEYFESHRSFPDLEGYRSLCNGLKAALIEMAAQTVRRAGGGKSPRLAVVDIGSGRGGDISKWCRYRPRLYLGVDGSEVSVLEARRRHDKLAYNGRGGLVASFATVDVRTEALPLEGGEVDIASLQFSMQYSFDTQAGAEHLVSELARVVRPGGLAIALLPDGDRLAALLGRSASETTVRFGHFLFRKFEKTLVAIQTADPPVGIPYSFTLGSRRDACPEYLVSPRYLESLLAKAGFVGALSAERFSLPVHEFYDECPSKDVVSVLTRARPCCPDDWMTMGIFRAVVAQRRAAPLLILEPSSSVTAAPQKRQRRAKGSANKKQPPQAPTSSSPPEEHAPSSSAASSS